jgi:hypothetical protein
VVILIVIPDFSTGHGRDGFTLSNFAAARELFVDFLGRKNYAQPYYMRSKNRGLELNGDWIENQFHCF